MSPFPSLDPIYGAPWPLYDYSENLVADTDTFTNKFSYVSDSKTKVHSYVISMSVLAAFFLILGIVAFTVYKIKDPKRKNAMTIYEDVPSNPTETAAITDRNSYTNKDEKDNSF